MVERQAGQSGPNGKDVERLARAVLGGLANGGGGEKRSRAPTAALGSLSPSAQTTVPPQLTVAPVPRAGQQRPASTLNVPRPMLRTRSTDGATTDSKSTNSEFVVAESPSPVLTTPAHGLSGLSEALAHLVNDHSGQVRNGRADANPRSEITTAFDEHRRPTNDHVKAHAGVHQADVTALIAEASKNGRRLSATMNAAAQQEPGRDSAQQDRSGSSSRRPSNAIDRLRLLDAAADRVDGSTSHAATSTSTTYVKKHAPGHSPSPFSTFSPFQHRAIHEPGEATTILSSPAVSNAGMSLSSSPHASGKSTPMHSSNSRSKPKVLETSHLHLQTHAASGRRMINQYIIEDELGRGVHGKVRLARDTETGERVAVKIVEREAKKRLGGPNALVGAGRQSDAWRKASGGEASFDNGGREEASANAIDGPPIVDETSNDDPASKDGQQRTRFVQPPSSRDGQTTPGFKSEKQREMARKRLLWTTDQKVKREIAIMKKCAHENVVGLKEVIDDPQSKKIFMVLEHMEGGEVQWKDERGFPTLTVDEARRTLRDVVLGLEYLHYQGIIHRDIKPANLLWTLEHRVKISDFGVSHYSYALLVASGGLPSYDANEEPSLTDDRELAKTAGSPAFFAPELCLAGEPAFSSLGRSSGRGSVKGDVGEVDGEFPWSERNDERGGSSERKARPPISKAIDIWALGVTLYCLLFGHVPFTADSEYALFNVITREDFEIPRSMGADRIKIGPRKRRWVHQTPWTDEEGDVDEYSSDRIVPDADPSTLSEDAILVRDLLDRLLQKDPTKRIKLDEVKKHPWLTRDIADPPQWLNETDPALLPSVQITHEDVETALTGFSKFKQTLKRFQTKLFSTLGGAAHAQGYDRDSRSSSRPGTPGAAPQLTTGPPARRRRSKSASHASRDIALTAASAAKATTAAPSARTSPNNTIYLDGSSGSNATTVTSKPTGGLTGSQAAAATLVAKPHLLFSRRRSSALAEEVGAAAAGQQTRVHPTSVSQPNSRPASPTSATMHSSTAERHHFAHRNIFRRSHHDANLDAAVPPAVDPSSRPQTGTANTFSSRMRPGSRASLRGTFEALSPMTDASKSGDTIPLTSESASLSRNPSSSASHTVPNRPRSRSRLAEVFRNVMSHHDKQGGKKGGGGGADGRSLRFLSRPGTGLNSAAVSPTVERSAGDSMAPISSPTLPAQLRVDGGGGGVTGPTIPNATSPKSKSAPISPKQSAEAALNEVVATKSGAPRPRSAHRKSAGSGGARAIDVDDYDVDFDLSEEDDSDDVHATNGSHPTALFRATRDGWARGADQSESGSGAANSKDSSLTPSVEGGYNIFKPAYSGGHFLVDDLPRQDDQFAMDLTHSHDAAALRRAQRADESRGERRQKEVTAAGVADLSAVSDDRFADADEEASHNGNGAAVRLKDEDQAPLYHHLQRHPFTAMQRGSSVTTSSEISEGASPGALDDDDFGVSFQTGRRTAAGTRQ